MTVHRLSGPELLELRDALRDAFDYPSFTDLLLRLDRRLSDYTGPNDDLPTALRKVLEKARAQLWWWELLREARFAVPADPTLQSLGERYDLSARVVATTGGQPATLVAGPQLEIKVKAAQSSFAIAPWRARLGAIEGQVCRVELGKAARGTGFLIGPDRVLTNYHVVEPVIDDPSRAAKLLVRFDHKQAATGEAVYEGTTYALAEDWLIDASPPSPQDRYSQPPADPEPDQLDYAVIRLAKPAGREPVGGPTNADQVAERGWIEGPDQEYPFDPASALYIVQHPDGGALQVALDTDAVLSRNGNGTRVRYTTTTQPGSSGSPCFDADWGLVALHHAGDPAYAALGAGSFNQGIPITAIQALLEQRNLAAVFGPDAL